jgi:hypothetical protein
MPYDLLDENEDDFFAGTPKSKFFDVVRGANEEISEDEISNIIEKLAAMMFLFAKDLTEDELENKITQAKLNNSSEIDEILKGLYLEFSGDIISRLDS